jgi:hypothetical protein
LRGQRLFRALVGKIARRAGISRPCQWIKRGGSRLYRNAPLCFAGSITSLEMLADSSDFPGYASVRYQDVPVKDTECFEDLVWEHTHLGRSRVFGFATKAVDGVVECARVHFSLYSERACSEWRDVLKLGLDDVNIVDMEFFGSKQKKTVWQQWEAAIVAEAVAGDQVAELMGKPRYSPPDWPLVERPPVQTEWYAYVTECILRGSLTFAGALCI